MDDSQVDLPISPSPSPHVSWRLQASSLQSSPLTSMMFPMISISISEWIPYMEWPDGHPLLRCFFSAFLHLKHPKSREIPDLRHPPALGTWMISSTKCSRGCFRTLGTSTTFSTIWTSGISWMISCRAVPGVPGVPGLSWIFHKEKTAWHVYKLYIWWYCFEGNNHWIFLDDQNESKWVDFLKTMEV